MRKPLKKECTWVVGQLGALSGSLADIGKPIFQSVELALEQANEDPAVPCRLRLKKVDTRGEPEKARTGARRLLQVRKLIACACGLFSGEIVAAGHLISAEGVPFYGTGTAPQIRTLGLKSWFRVIAPDDVQGEMGGRYMQEIMGATSAVVAYEKSDYGKTVAKGALDGLAGVTTTSFAVDPSQSNFSRLAKKIRKISPDVVYFVGYPEQSGALLAEMRRIGVDAKFVTTDGSLAPEFAKYADGFEGGTIATCSCTDALADPRTEAFVAEAKKRFPNSYAHSAVYGVEMYDVTSLLTATLEQLDGTEPIKKVRAHIINSFRSFDDQPGITKSYTWQATGELEPNPSQIFVYAWEVGGFALKVSVGDALASQ